MSAGFTGWAVEALIASSLLMAFVLLVRKPAQRAIGAQLAYWLWALPVLRMAMPPLPASWRESAAAPITAASETVLVLVGPVLPLAPADTAPFPWLALVAGAWVLGALGFFGWHGLAHFSYVRRIVSPPARHAQLPDGTTLVESDEAIGPVAFGVLRRFVAVPSDFAERYDADERKLALAHELGHHARGDLIANWIGLAMLAVHWFNPLAWVAYRKFRGDQELANDARVLAALPPIERHAYACAIVKAAHGRAVTAACHLHTIEDLKGRLRMLKASRKSRRVAVAGAVGIAALTVAGLGLTASGAAAEKLRSVAETQVAAMATAAADDAPAGTRNYVTEHSVREDDHDGRRTRTSKLVIRGKDGRTRTYLNADADAYLAAHPELAPPPPPAAPGPVGAAPPMPPMPHMPSPGAVPPMPPMPNVPSVVTSVDGRTIVSTIGSGNSRIVSRVSRRPGGSAYTFHAADEVEVVSGDCPGGMDREFVRKEVRNGKSRMIICEKRIERFAEAQARNAERTARLAEVQARYSRTAALAGLNAGRMAILNTRGLTEEQRERALAGIEEARAEMEAEMRANARDD